MSQPKIDYVEHYSGDGREQPVIVGGNGEIQARLEWYDNHSNAVRGVHDLYSTLGILLESPLEVVGDPDDAA